MEEKKDSAQIPFYIKWKNWCESILIPYSQMYMKRENMLKWSKYRWYNRGRGKERIEIEWRRWKQSSNLTLQMTRAYVRRDCETPTNPLRRTHSHLHLDLHLYSSMHVLTYRHVLAFTQKYTQPSLPRLFVELVDGLVNCKTLECWVDLSKEDVFRMLMDFLVQNIPVGSMSSMKWKECKLAAILELNNYFCLIFKCNLI